MREAKKFEFEFELEKGRLYSILELALELGLREKHHCCLFHKITEPPDTTPPAPEGRPPKPGFRSLLGQRPLRYGGSQQTNWSSAKRKISKGYYRFDEVYAYLRAQQPGICLFGVGGDLRWPGNESGVVPPESGCTRDDGAFHPYEADFPLRPGWFYHKSQDGYSRSGEFLMKIYLRTVGNAAIMDIGISPDTRGILTDEDIGCLRRSSSASRGRRTVRSGRRTRRSIVSTTWRRIRFPSASS